MDRVRCVVVHCQHTTRKFKSVPVEWVCADHWRHVPRKWKTLKRRLEKKLKTYTEANTESLRVFAVYMRVWKRCKDEANQGALGIG